jgi:hypothetical protein
VLTATTNGTSLPGPIYGFGPSMTLTILLIRLIIDMRDAPLTEGCGSIHPASPGMASRALGQEDGPARPHLAGNGTEASRFWIWSISDSSTAQRSPPSLRHTKCSGLATLRSLILCRAKAVPLRKPACERVIRDRRTLIKFLSTTGNFWERI